MRSSIGSLNEDPRQLASSTYAIQVFQDALLNHSAGYVLGLPGCPLADLYKPLPCCDVRLSTRVAEHGLRKRCSNTSSRRRSSVR